MAPASIMAEMLHRLRIVLWLVFGERRTLRASFIAGTCGPGPPGPGCPWRCHDGAAAASTSLVPVQPVFTESERLAIAGFLAGYRGLTREAQGRRARSAQAASALSFARTTFCQRVRRKRSTSLL
jgi:hypothetical protein